MQTEFNSTDYFELNLSHIVDDPITEVRLGPKDKDEAKKLKELSQDIAENGLIEPVVVRKVGDNGSYAVIAGHRRVAAIKLLGQDTVHAVLRDADDDQAARIAISENLKRKNFSPYSLALLMQKIRKQFNWGGEEGTRPVAEYLGVSPATVTEHEKLLTMVPKEVQQAVHAGAMSFAAAQELWQNVQPEKVGKVAAKAQEIADREAASSTPSAKKQAARKGKEPDKQVKKKHVQAAAKEEKAEKVVKARGRNELLDPFNMILEAAEGYQPSIVALAKYIVKTYAPGNGSSNGVVAKFNEIDEAITEAKVMKKHP